MKTAFVNGLVYTGELPLREAFIVENGCFGSIGSNSKILSAVGPEDQTVDLGGRFVCAGFCDSHMHLLSFGNFLHNVRLNEHTGCDGRDPMRGNEAFS